jgi:hypothetical protein
MTCEHLAPLEEALLACGLRETYRGQAWSQHCREWVYFDCYLDLAAVRASWELPACVQEHVHCGTHDGQERGFVCTLCDDGIMGRHAAARGVPVFPG